MHAAEDSQDVVLRQGDVEGRDGALAALADVVAGHDQIQNRFLKRTLKARLFDPLSKCLSHRLCYNTVPSRPRTLFSVLGSQSLRKNPKRLDRTDPTHVQGTQHSKTEGRRPATRTLQ